MENTSNSILNQLAIKHQTDKYNSHWYTPHYDLHFNKYRDAKINLLEIGVGGYEDHYSGGYSLRMWKEYFKEALIYGVDLFEKIGLEEERIKIFCGSQCDEAFLKAVKNSMEKIHIIIDDGSHVNKDIVTTFKILFPLLEDGGIYVIEDTQTCYWPDYGGDSINLNNSNTAMNFFKGLVDGLNYEEYINPTYESSYYDMNIISMHFYHNLIFIYKGVNNEGSNCIKDNGK